ncbi:MAG: 30S ribosomal protein S12 methylthiotransferase RimO [bacterium]
MPSAAVILLGCPKNQVDTEYALGSLERAGWQITTDPASSDLVVITTCAFLGSAVRESESVIERTLELKRRRPELKVVVGGCLVQRFGAELGRRFPEVDLWVGIDALPDIPRLLRLRARSFLCAEPCALVPAGAARLLSTPRHFAYLKVADGCDNRCSYCLIPSIRGRLRSRPAAAIVAEARGLVRLGARELILVAQDTTAWGADLPGRPQLPGLLARLGRIRDLRWIRLMYAHPAHVTGELLDEFAHNPKLCRYIDLPIQHVSDRILEAMNRHYTCSDLDRLLERARALPEVRLRTTIIVGFPGETAREFRSLLDFVRAARFDRLSAYAYSPEPGTAAAALPRPVSDPVKRERIRELMRVQAAISRSRLRRLVGTELDVLVDAPGLGRTEWDAPEVDGTVKLTGPKVEPGAFVRCRVTGSSTHDLVATVL